jgi:hypothetical protein
MRSISEFSSISGFWIILVAPLVVVSFPLLFHFLLEMPPLPVMELQQRFDPLLLPPSLLQNPTWMPGTRRDTFYRYHVRKMVFLVTASVCDEGGLETAMPSLLEADLGIICSYLRYILIILVSGDLQGNIRHFNP